MGEQSERRIIGYDVGTGGDGGPVFARPDGAGESHIEGETLGQCRARHGLPGIDTPAADRFVWRSGAWTDKDRPRRDDAVGLVREPFVPSAKAAAETVEVLRRVGEGDAAELARLLPGLASDANTARRLGHTYSPTVERVASAAELLTRERERLMGDLRISDAMVSRAARDLSAARARVAELEAANGRLRTAVDRVCNLRHVERDESSGDAEIEAARDAATDALVAVGRAAEQARATDDAPFLVALRAWEKATRGANDVIVYDLPATLALLDATRSTLAAPSVDAVGKVVAEALASIGDCSFGLEPSSYLGCAIDGAEHARKNFADGAAANARADMVSAACSLLCAIVACDAAKGGDRG